MIADSATDLESARLLTLSCAMEMDRRGNRSARDKIAMIKVAVPKLTMRVVDRAVQVCFVDVCLVVHCALFDSRMTGLDA